MCFDLDLPGGTLRYETDLNGHPADDVTRVKIAQVII